MLEDIDRTDWIEESKNAFNIIGKNIGLKDLIRKDNSEEEYKTNKLFINSKEDETIEHLTCKIYILIEKWFLSRGILPEYIVLSKEDYKKLLDRTIVVDDNCILGIKIDLLREKRNYESNRNSNFSFRNRKYSTGNRHSFAR